MAIQEGSIERASSADDAACDGMALSIDWDPNTNAALFCSSSNGWTSHCKIAEADMRVQDAWQAHNMEVWMVSCDRHKVWSSIYMYS
jgi:hypothetical protein